MEQVSILASALAGAAEVPLIWVMVRLISLGRPLTVPDKRPLGIP